MLELLIGYVIGRGCGDSTPPRPLTEAERRCQGEWLQDIVAVGRWVLPLLMVAFVFFGGLSGCLGVIDPEATKCHTKGFLAFGDFLTNPACR